MKTKRIKIALQNHTEYRTDDLRRFFRAGLRAMHASADKTIEVKYVTSNRHICWATMGRVVHTTVLHDGVATTRPFRTVEGRWIRMVIARPETGALDLARFARVFEHEVLHNRGVSHREMTPHQRACDLPLPEWAAGLELRVREPEPTLSPADRALRLRATREQHARAKLAYYEAKARRVAGLVKKWRAKVRYYERVTAKAAKGMGEQHGES